MGRKLESKADEIKDILKHVKTHIKSIHDQVPDTFKENLDEYGIYVYYIGLGMSCLVLLVLSCHILGKKIWKIYKLSKVTFILDAYISPINF